MNAIVRLTRILGHIDPVSPMYGMKDKPTPMTSKVPRVKCLSSVVLNQKTFAVG